MVNSAVSNLSHSDYLNYQLLLNKLSAKKKGQCYFCNSANKYGVTAYLNLLSISNFYSIKLKLFWLSDFQVILDNKLSATKTKTIFLANNAK